MIEPTWTSDCGTVKLWLGDCLEVMATWPDGAVDAVVTDPPYSSWYRDEYRYADGTLEKVLGCREKFICFWTPSAPFPLKYDSAHCWDKVVGTNTQFEMVYLRGFSQGHQILRNYMTPHSSVRAKICRDVSTNHKSQKPVRLMERLCRDTEGTIADPFMGSGTTGVAAVSLGRKFLGVEIDPEYFAIAKRRIQDELRRVDFLEGRTQPRYVEKQLRLSDSEA